MCELEGYTHFYYDDGQFDDEPNPGVEKVDAPEQVICANCGNAMEQNEIHEETWTGKYRNVLVVKDYIRYYCEHCENWR